MDINSNKKMAKVFISPLIIVMLGISLIYYVYPDLQAKYDGLSRHSPYRGLALGLFCVGYGVFDIVRRYIKAK